MILGMLSVQDPTGNRVPLPENTFNMKQGQESDIASVSQQTQSFQKFSRVPAIQPVPLSGQQNKYAEVSYTP